MSLLPPQESLLHPPLEPSAADPAGAKRSLSSIAFVALSMYVLVRPVSNNGVLFSVMAILGLMAILRLLFRPMRKLTRGTQNCFFLYFFWAVSWFGIGAVKGNPGLSNALLTYLLGPVLFYLIVRAITEQDLRTFCRSLAWVNLYLGLSIANGVLYSRGNVPFFLPIFRILDQGFAVDTNGALAARFYGISTLVALTPLLISSLLMNSPAHYFGPRWIQAVSVASSVLAALMVGRQALLLVLVVSPLVSTALSKRLPTSHRSAGTAKIFPRELVFAVVLPLALFAMFQLLGVRPSSFSKAFVRDLEISRSSTVSAPGVRTEEAGKLVSGWLKSPIYGSGFNGVIPGYARSDDRPWAFELQYQMLLFNTGILGVGFLICSMWSAAKDGLTVLRRGGENALVIVPLGVAALSMLIANGTNPYLQAVGHMWAIFVPVAAVNMFLVDRPVNRTVQPN